MDLAVFVAHLRQKMFMKGFLLSGNQTFFKLKKSGNLKYF